MSLPYNSYDQLKYRGNEYVTDQTLNRGVYRMFQNDVYLDEKMSEHINDDSVHYFYEGDVGDDYLSSDKLVVLCAQLKDGEYVSMEDVVGNSLVQEYLQKSWQRTIDSQPKNLGGYSLVFRFQLSINQIGNPDTATVVTVEDMLDFSGFFGGNLVIECPAYQTGTVEQGSYQDSNSCYNQNLILAGKGNANAVMNVSDCHANVIIRNVHVLASGIRPTPLDPANNRDFDGKEKESRGLEDGTVWINDRATAGDDGSYECKRWSPMFKKWFDLNMLAGIRITNCPDVLIKHCYIEY